MTITHFILRWTHISMAMLGLLSGAAAMTFRKGTPLHRHAGNVFFVSMLTMSAAGFIIAVFITPVMANVMGGATAFYLVLTAWLTVWRPPGQVGRLEIGAALWGASVAIVGFTFGTIALNSPKGMLHEFPATGYFVFASVVTIATLFDVRMIARGGLTGAPRITRHLTRMCFALFMATGSFFLGQAKLFPTDIRQSGILTIPAFLPFGLLLYWLIRVRVWPLIRRIPSPFSAVGSNRAINLTKGTT